MKFGEKLREQREQAGLSQDALAEIVGVSRVTIANYERGANYPQDRKVYSRLAEAFQVDVNYFLTEDEEFLTQAAERHGKQGLLQAEEILEQTAMLFSGGGLSEEAKLAFFYEMQAIFFDSDERAQKRFAPKKHRR